jgi:heat shock protein HslJ
MLCSEDTMRPIHGYPSALALIVGMAGCMPSREPSSSPPPAPAATAAVTIVDRDWHLAALGERVNPVGSRNRPVTLRLDATRSNAGGFAGCNQYGSDYALRGDSLTFGPPISTKMACAEGMDVENLYLAALPRVRTYQATESTLVLVAAEGPVARYRRP